MKIEMHMLEALLMQQCDDAVSVSYCHSVALGAEATYTDLLRLCYLHFSTGPDSNLSSNKIHAGWATCLGTRTMSHISTAII